jgi:hypothetical protein
MERIIKMPQDNNKLNFIRHNKKRNAGLLYEFLVRQIAKEAAFSNNSNQCDVYLEMLTRYFDPRSELGKELKIVKEIAERSYKSKELAVHQISEFCKKIESIDHNQSNIEKSNLIKEINYSIGKKIYSLGVPNYRLYTSIYGLIESVKSKNYKMQSQYEELVLENLLTSPENEQQDIISEDQQKLTNSNVFYEIAERKFNEKIKSMNLNSEQKIIFENYFSYQYNVLDEDAYSVFIKNKISNISKLIESEIRNINEKDKFVYEKLSEACSVLKKSIEEIDNVDHLTILAVEGASFYGN